MDFPFWLNTYGLWREEDSLVWVTGLNCCAFTKVPVPMVVQQVNVMNVLLRHERKWHYHTEQWWGRLELSMRDVALPVADLYSRWDWEVLFHSPDWSPCDDLIPKMKEPLHGLIFQTVPKILQAVDRSIRNIYRTGAATEIRLPHRWLMLLTLKDCRSFTQVSHSRYFKI